MERDVYLGGRVDGPPLVGDGDEMGHQSTGCEIPDHGDE